MTRAAQSDTAARETALDDDEHTSGCRNAPLLADRRELAAVVELVDGAASAGFDRAALVRWVDEHLVARGVMPRPALLTEPGVRPVPLRGPDVDRDQVRALLAVVRARVTETLLGLRGHRRDDRFVAAAIFAGRVRRVSVEGRSRWIATTSAGNALSDILMALLAVDVLARRDLYDAPRSIEDEDAWA